MIGADELQEKVSKLQGLINRKKASERELQEIEKEINIVLVAMGHIDIKHEHRIRTNNVLSNYILKVMAPGAHMSLKTVSEKILAAGYTTTNTRFASYLHTVFSNRDDIRKVRRGVYTRVQNLVQKGSGLKGVLERSESD